MSVSKTRLMTAATTAVAGLLLTGCGSAAPGIAARVGDEELTVRQVDRTAEQMCRALGDQFAANNTVTPMGYIRQGTVRLLALRAQSMQIADDYGIEPGSTYENAVAQSRGTAATMPEDVQDTFLELDTASALATDIVNQIGAIILDDQGVADPTEEQVTQAGADAFNQWPDAHGIEIDPRYGLESVDGALSPVDTNTSVAVSDLARSGSSSEPDASYADALIPTQRCG